MAAMIRARAVNSRENWLLVGVSDHGGLGKSFGSNPMDDPLVSLFASTFSMHGAGTALQPFTYPTTQFDVAPTVLKWLGVSYNASGYDGVPQGICSDGKFPANCSQF